MNYLPASAPVTAVPRPSPEEGLMRIAERLAKSTAELRASLNGTNESLRPIGPTDDPKTPLELGIIGLLNQAQRNINHCHVEAGRLAFNVTG